jgi:hypothetical protein
MSGSYFPLQEDIVDAICTKTQTSNRHFFRILTCYQFAKLASMMRACVITQDRGTIPINIYALNLSPSGSGKGFSMNIFEETLSDGFRDRFLEEIFPMIASNNLNRIAQTRSIRDRVDEAEWQEKLDAEFAALGPLVFGFDSATTPAVKQMRQKLLLAQSGSMNLEIDEISSNFTGNMDVLVTFLELFDKGLIKQKLTKNTKENLRTEEVYGQTPTNLMLFGTPVKLMDGSKVQDDFIEMLEIGYARRLLVGFSTEVQQVEHQDAKSLFKALTDKSVTAKVQQMAAHITSLASSQNFQRLLKVEDSVTLRYLDYKLECEARAKELPEHEETAKAEMAHRYFKVIKTAGAYAFMDKSTHLTEDHVEYAINMVEDSGDQFVNLLKKEGPYVKLAKYIASVGREVTHVDLIENLPFYKGTKMDKTELIEHACAYGYQNNIIIKKRVVGNIEFLSGESLKETDLDKILISYSNDVVLNFVNTKVPFNQLHKLVCGNGFNYCSHAFQEGYRHSDKVIPGFNLLILDMDHGLKMYTAVSLLSKYEAFFATTKRHTAEDHRFRIILPMSHMMKLTTEDHVKFMENFFSWLPFEVDTAPKDIARKWLSHPGQYHYNHTGHLIDATAFIPRTQKEQEAKKELLSNNSLNNLQRWFVRNTRIGNRNQMLLRYGFACMDGGQTAMDATIAVKELNTKLPEPLDTDEIDKTIMSTLFDKQSKTKP